ncbi:MAG: proteasome subunit alpha, partial [Acidimicrobiales bacterium]|nr:proteasome subunit alpha [Acidimicrobiales bacterium]
ADLKGFSFSREDVDARSLANQYAQILGQVFTHEMKPLEVEILVAEVGTSPDDDQLFHLLYDGTVVDQHAFSVLGGDAEAVAERFSNLVGERCGLGATLGAAVQALAGSERELTPADLEVAILERSAPRRCFRRLDDGEVGALLEGLEAKP